MAISGVGTNYYQAGTPTFAVNVSPAAIGNCFLLYTNFNDITKTVTGIVGGGVLNWTNVASYNSSVYRHELWLGQPVNTLGIQAVTLTFSGSMSTTNVEIDVQEFTNGNMATVWAVDGSQTGHANDATNQTTILFANLTPSTSTAELYFGAARDGTGTAVAGSTAGYTYQINAAGNVILYNENVTAASAPTCTESPAGPYTSISALITATVWGDVQGGTAGPNANAQPSGISFAFGSDVTAGNRIEAKVGLNEQTGPGQITLSGSGTAQMGQWIRITEAHITVSGYDCVAESWTAVVLASGSLTVTAVGANASQQWQMSMCCRERSGLSTADDITCVDTAVISVWDASPFQVSSPASVSANGLASVGYFDVGSSHTITAGTGFTLRDFSGSSGTCETALEDVGFGPAGSVVTGQWNGWDPGTSRCLDVVLFRQVNDPGPNTVYPDGDAVVDSWTTDTGATTNLWQSINENPANDANYIKKPQNPAAWGFVQAIAPAVTTGTGTSHPLTFSSNVATNNRIILKIELNESNAPAGTLISVANSGTATLGTWVKVSETDGTASGFSLRGETWTAVVLAGGSCTVTISGLTGTDTWQIAAAAAEYSGLSTANDATCVDVSATTTWGATGTVTSPATTAANELVTGGYYDDGQSRTITAGAGFTQRGYTGTSGIAEAAIEDKDSGASGSTIAVTFTGGATAGAATDVVIFKLAAPVPVSAMYYEALLQAPTDPPSAAAIAVHYRYEGSTAAPLGLVVSLIQGSIAAPAFATVGSLVQVSASGATTVSVTSHAVGNAWLLLAKISTGSPIAITGITGGGATWQQVAGPFYDNSAAADEEIWLGTITSIVTSNNIVIAFNGSVSGVLCEYNVQEFSSSLGSKAVWSADVAGTLNNPSSTNEFWPSLTNTGQSPEIYFGYCRVPGSMTGTPQTGVVFTTDVNGNVMAWHLNVLGGASLAPAGTSGASQQSWTIAVLIRVGVIATWTIASLPTSWTQADQALSLAQGNAITDYTNLRLRFVPSSSQQRIVPDAILLQTNLVGAISAIQDSPAAPDATWLTATSTSAASILRVSTPTPAATPTVGAGLQTFRAWLRKKGGTGTPTATLELWESGVLKATVLAATNITSATGQLITGTWNASLLGTASGINAEIRITGTVGGSGGTAATIEVGAVDWLSTETGQVQVSWASLDLPNGVIRRQLPLSQAVHQAAIY